MSLEAALIENTNIMRELIAALLATSKQALNIAPAEVVNVTATIEAKGADKPVATVEKVEAKKPEATPVTDTTPKSGEASTSNLEGESKAYTFAEVQKLVTTLAAPGAYADGRAKAVAVLQRHGLKKFTEDQVKGDQALIEGVGAMLEAAIAGEIDPREGA